MVKRGIKILSKYPVSQRFVLGHSFGGLIAKEIANQIEVNNCILVCAPIDSASYHSAFENYSALASEETRQLEKVYNTLPSDENLTAWLASYGKLYFSEGQLIEGKVLLLNDLANAKAFQQLSNFGVVACTEISKKHAKGKILIIIGGSDNLIDPSILKKSCNDLNFNFATIPNGSHFCIFEDAKMLKEIITRFR